MKFKKNIILPLGNIKVPKLELLINFKLKQKLRIYCVKLISYIIQDHIILKSCNFDILIKDLYFFQKDYIVYLHAKDQFTFYLSQLDLGLGYKVNKVTN